MSTSSIDENHNLQMEELYSKIHDERRCITAKSLAIEMGITRSEAANLLEALPYFRQNEQTTNMVYDITRCVWNKVDGQKYVARLQKSKLEVNPSGSASEEKSNCNINKNIIHSLALNVKNHGSSSPQSAHAYTMTLLFNALEDGSFVDNVKSNPDLIHDKIQPAVKIHVESAKSLRNRRVRSIGTTGGGSNSNSKVGGKKETTKSTSIPPRASNSSNSKKVLSKKKTTTAASFFGTVTKKVNEQSKNSISKEKSSTTTKTATGGKSKTIKAPSSTSIATSLSQQSAKKDEPHSQKDETKTKSKSKTNTISKTSTSSSRKSTKKEPQTYKGNADDFVGDEDEDEDFLQEEKERKKRIATDTAKRRTKESKQQQQQQQKQEREQQKQRNAVSTDGESMDVDVDEDNETENEKEEISGAIDAFATVAKKKHKDSGEGSLQKGRKRRKQVLEEKTYVDGNGFLRTENVTVWKDVEEDEEEEEKSKNERNSMTKNKNKPSSSSSAGAKKAKNTKGMKQQGLMGFFTVKKKN